MAFIDTLKVIDDDRPQREPLPDDEDMAYFCRDCKHVIEYVRRGRRKACSECKGPNISLATKRALRNVYKLQDEAAECVPRVTVKRSAGIDDVQVGDSPDDKKNSRKPDSRARGPRSHDSRRAYPQGKTHHK